MKRYFIVLICGLFIASPIDLCPELVLGPLGLCDDLVAGVVGWRALFHKAKA